jgi:hypothetical protein
VVGAALFNGRSAGAVQLVTAVPITAANVFRAVKIWNEATPYIFQATRCFLLRARLSAGRAPRDGTAAASFEVGNEFRCGERAPGFFRPPDGCEARRIAGSRLMGIG